MRADLLIGPAVPSLPVTCRTWTDRTAEPALVRLRRLHWRHQRAALVELAGVGLLSLCAGLLVVYALWVGMAG